MKIMRKYLSFTLEKIFIIILFNLIFYNNITKADETIEKYTILTDIKPIASIIMNIAGSDFDVVPIIEANDSPHDYVLKPSDVKKMSEAEMLFLIDKKFDSSIYKASLRNKQLKTIILFDFNQLPKKRLQSLLEVDDDHDDDHDETNNNIYDKHFWLSPNAVSQASDFITEKLSRLYPVLAWKFVRNNVVFQKKIKSLVISTNKKFSLNKPKSYLTFHDSLQYFESDFNLDISKAIHVEPQEILTEKKIKGLREVIKEQNVTCVLAEPQFNTRQIKSIVRGFKISVGQIDILASQLQTNTQLYFKMIGNITDALIKCSKK